jgi:uridine phosphorylase
MFLVSPEDVQREALEQGISRTELELPPLVFLTFNRCVLDELSNLCQLQDWEWPGGRFTPYSPPDKGWRGKIDKHDVAVFIPNVGASTLVCLCEELILYGARTLFLLCASWGLGQAYLDEGQIHLPSFAIGMDGTSPHYGNSDWRAEAEPRAFKALATALDKVGAVWKEGGVGCCEALYRITPQLAEAFRQQGCLSIENGEVAALYSLARERDIPIGVLLQPYIDLEQGWRISFMGEEYSETGRLQAQAAIEASRILMEEMDSRG